MFGIADQRIAVFTVDRFIQEKFQFNGEGVAVLKQIPRIPGNTVLGIRAGGSAAVLSFSLHGTGRS